MTKTSHSLPIADVYAGDTAIPRELGEDTRKVILFTLEADAEPGVLARVANIFNLANIAPRSATLRSKSLYRVHISVEIELINATIAEMIRRKLAQLTCIFSVEVIAQSVVGNPL